MPNDMDHVVLLFFITYSAASFPNKCPITLADSSIDENCRGTIIPFLIQLKLQFLGDIILELRETLHSSKLGARILSGIYLNHISFNSSLKVSSHPMVKKYPSSVSKEATDFNSSITNFLSLILLGKPKPLIIKDDCVSSNNL